jgi:PST family polysaccharide transporter
VLLGDVLFPIWLFQGLEILDYVAKITIPTRIFFTALIFLLVKEPTDYIFIPLLYSLGPLISGVIGIFIANSKLNVKFVFPSIYEIKSLIKEGFLYFLSRASITFYNSTNVILVKFILGDFYAGLYAAASKLIKALRRVLQPLYISIFPYFSKKERMMSKKYRKLNMLILFSTTFLITFISGIVFISSDVIIKTFFGDKFLLSVKILKILILSIPFYHIAAYIGASILVPFGFKKTFNYSVIIPSFFHLFILLVIYLLKLNNIFIVAATVVFTQIFISLIRIGKLFIVNKEKGKY